MPDLTSDQRVALQTALTETFSSVATLAGAVAAAVNVPVQEITTATGDAAVADAAFEVVEWALDEDRVEELLRLIRKQNPLHPGALRLAGELLKEAPEAVIREFERQLLPAGSGDTLELLRERVLPAVRRAGRADLETEVLRRLFTAPWLLRSLEVRSVRNVEHVLLKFDRSLRPGQWLFLVGENGAGKSSLLRAICLALCSDAAANALLGYLSADAPTIRRGSDTARVELTGGWPVPPRVVRRAERLEQVEARLEFSPPFLVAYGARRGSAAGGTTENVMRELDNPVAAVATLFDERSPVISAQVWLTDEADAAERAGSGSERDAFLRAVERALAGFLPGGAEANSMEVTGEGVWVTGPQVGTHTPLAALSDGYLTTLGWTVDFIARWAAEARRRGLPVDGEFAQRMAGVVLVDDIDVHLHPRWQYTLVDDLSRTFPQLTFVVTTHNPLTLLGAEEGEVHLVRQGAEGVVEVRQIDIPLGMDVDQILTGEWFGLPATLDPDTVALIRRYQAALLEDHASPETRQLQRDLIRRLGSPWPRESTGLLSSESAERAEPASDATRRKASEWLAARRRARGSGPAGDPQA